MPDSRSLLARLLNTPTLATIVPRLPPDVLRRVIERCGLEDCAEVVALATPAQIARILDVDLWRVRAAGVADAAGIDETFDVDRFVLWIEVLMQAGASVAAEKLAGLDIELAIAGFSRLAAVFEYAAVSSFTTLDGEERRGRAPHDHGGSVAEIGGYVIEAGRRSPWDAMVELLTFLDSERPEYFHRLMRGCVRLSSGPREADGFHQLLGDQAQDMFDLAGEREGRREQQGYVTPAQARAFLQGARELRIDADQPPHSPVARAYFRAIEPSQPAAADAPQEPVEALPASVIEVLEDAGVLAPLPRALLQAADELSSESSSRLALVEAYVESHEECAPELAYLANAIVAGCTIQDRAFTPQEASDAAVAICNLGLENWPPNWLDRDLITAFQVGWMTLHRNVCLYVAQRLIDVVAHIRCRDRDIQLRLHALARELVRHLRDKAPWHARQELDVIVMLDAPSWAALLALIDECPVMHAAIAPRPSRHAINIGDFAFISENSQVNAIRAFMESLPSILVR